MPTYSYTAKPQPNKTVQGNIEAESEQEALQKLTKMGYFPLSLETEDISKIKRRFFWKGARHDIVIFTRQLASLLQSGVNIIKSLDIIYEQTPNKYLKAVIADIISKIKDGRSLSESLAVHPSLFPGVYTSMVHSGEAGGTIEQAMKRLSDYLEKEEEFKSSVASSLVYPVFVCLVGILTLVVLLVFVIPRLVSMFEDMGQVLPLPTRILIAVSGFMRSYWWLILAVGIIIVFSWKRIKRNPQGRMAIDTLKLKIAVWGELELKAEISRLTRTFSLLLASGMPVVTSLEIVNSMIENQLVRTELGKCKEKITSGMSFSNSLKESKIFPVFVTNIVTVGEETGSLDAALLRIADEYERDVDRTLKTLMRLIEPVIILTVGVVVGFIVLSMLLPIFQINLIVK